MSSKHVRKDSVHTCVVCCEDIEFYATGACDHTVCYKCCVRMRVLGKEMYCAVCRTELDQVFLTKDKISYQKLVGNARSFAGDRRHGIRYQGKEIQEKVKYLLQHHCPFCPDHPPERFFDHLREHVRKVHEKFYCGLCVTHLRKFSSERKAYTRQELARHRRVGDADDTSHKGHPLCEFCDERYLDNDELHRHLRKEHFWCHFCERDGSQEYYPNYPSLRAHFRECHFLCEEGDCVHEQFTTVFRTKVDLQAHRATKHSQNLTKAQARQARQLDVDITFAPRPRPQASQFGVVTGRDFMEVRAAADQKQGKKQKGRTRGETSREIENRREMVDTQTAMAASLGEPVANGDTPISPPPLLKPQEPKKYKPEDKENNVRFSVDELSSQFATLGGSSKDSGVKIPEGRKTTSKSCPHGNAQASGPKQLSEDFPSLSASATIPEQLVSIPPGFAIAASQPVLLPQQTNHSKQSMNLKKPQGQAVKGKIQGNVGPIPEPATSTAKVDSIQERNQALVDKIRRLLAYDKPKFDKLKALSGKFRQGACSANEYYDRCCDLFGSNFFQVFSELVDLLPDVDKQKELLRVHQDAKTRAKHKSEQNKPEGTYKKPAPTGVWPVSHPTSGNVAPSQGAATISEQDFPALPASSKRTYQPSYRPLKTAAVLKEAWLRGK